MANEARVNIGYRIAGRAVDAQIVRQDEAVSSIQIAMPAARAGTLTTRTNDTTGVVTVAEGHGITDEDTVAVFWDGGRRYAVAVSATTATTVSIGSGGAGAVLPAEDSVVTICKETTSNLVVDGDDIHIIAVYGPSRLSANIRKAAGVSVKALDIPAKESFAYISGFSASNPFATESLLDAVVAHDEAAARTAEILLLKNTI